MTFTVMYAGVLLCFGNILWVKGSITDTILEKVYRLEQNEVKYLAVISEIKDRLQRTENNVKDLQQQLHMKDEVIQDLKTQNKQVVNILKELNAKANDARQLQDRIVSLERQKSGDCNDKQEDSVLTDTSTMNKIKQKNNVAGRSPRLLATSNSIAFHAIVSNIVQHIEERQAVVFDLIHLNVGGAFQSDQGIFTAPTSGLYVFSVSIATHQSNSTHEIDAALVKNGHLYGLVIGHGEGLRSDQGSITITMQLEVGDEVWVEITWPQVSAVRGSRYGETTFTGFRLSQ